jgi:hypothetical protein
MQQMNFAIDEQGRWPADVARGSFETHGLIGARDDTT